MTIFFTLLLILLLLGLLGCVFMLIRNDRVYQYRMEVIDKIRASFNSETPLKWEVYDNVPYSDMLNKFWRSFDSFFPPEYRPNK